MQGEWELVRHQCPVQSCIFTADVSLLDQSDVVVMYIDTMSNFPTNRRPDQRFVFFNLESPSNTNYEKINHPYVRFGYFNWTMTYRWDSDIVLRLHYGYIMAKALYNGTGLRYDSSLIHDWSKPHITANATLTSNVTTPSSIPTFVKGKKKLVAWFVGHCSTLIRREEYVRQLQQHVNVDIFGQCNKKECPHVCEEMLRTDYKFYLSFENSWCLDYVTEKFYRPLMYDTVPIVLGGANYNRFAPPHSYINARDFTSPRELSAYLLLLDKSDELYARYFDWKKDFFVTMPDLYGLCDLCRLANDETLPPKVYSDITEWWSTGNGLCENDSSMFF